MKKKMKLFVITLALAFSLLNLPLEKFVPAAKATYVEGIIGIDTVWSLVDSPFILSGNVTVLAGATLTIEPGVEVKFGGLFSLVVNGTLFSRGMEEKPIKFTSNKENPEAGDWDSILFNGVGQQPSVLENCLIEYGTNGVIVKGGTLTIQKSIIQFNSKNGIALIGGSITIEQNTLQNNNEGGVNISGGNALVQDNLIVLNGDGVTLTGDLSASNITIVQNRLEYNKKSGVFLEMDVSGSVSITHNVVASNFYGFYISTDASTFITHNYVLNNNIGAFYAKGTEHIASFNDIYSNTLGMDASSEAFVNAEQNYWGDRSGPYHESLNPRGKGNPVGGNGSNIDFIFFLTARIDYANAPPNAVLWADKTLVAPGQEVTFVGSYSHDDGRVDQYLFDFGDVNGTDWTTLSLFFHTYAETGNYTASLRVMDDFGSISGAASTLIRVVNLPPLNVELTLSSSTVHHNEEVTVTVHVSQGGNPVENANVTLFSVKDGSFSPTSDLTNSSGYLTATFRAPDVTEITNIRVIARASIEGFADGSSYKYLEVLPPLTVDVAADPSTVLSEELSTITVHVSWNGAPVSEALVSLSSNNGGNFSETEKLTDLNGEAVFIFKAPLTISEINTAIVAQAAKPGYGDGEGQVVVAVMPKVLSIRVSAQRSTTISEEAVNVTVHVEYEGTPIQDANVTISAEAGEWSPPTAYTNILGNATITFRTPPVPQETNITITATASKTGYASNSSSITLTAKPGNLTITVIPSAYTVGPEKTVGIAVYVKCGGRPVENANVTVDANVGTFTATSTLTNSSGYCEFSFLTPKTAETTSITVSVNAAKYGYASSTEYVYLTVVPEAAGGIPITTILLILIPVVLIVVVAVLIKMGVISISTSEEEE
ncbi:MAG: right-handed parallel beta-helix repeat-containing protein [Candidatus Bathyarchaeales archaeon]